MAKPHPTEKRAASRREGLLSLLTGAVAEPLAGIAGLYGLATGGLNKGADNIEATRNALTYQPRDPSSLQALGRAVAPLTDRIEAGKRYMGDGVLAKTGSPGLATAAHMVPDVLATLLGVRGMGVKGPTMAQMAERAPGPSMGSPVSQIGAINAWHGSPHDFDKFDMSKIGTGEGAQAYGHGLYFAGNKDVAANYRAVLSRPDSAGLTKAQDLAAWANSAGRNGESLSVLDDEIARLDRHNKWGATHQRADYEEARQILQDGKAPTSGALYNVELAPDDADLLDWDAPLSQQPEKVRAAIAQSSVIGRDSGGWQGAPEGLYDKNVFSRTGQEIHRNVMDHHGLDAAAASEHLRSLGIPGLRYLDGGSRSAGDGSRNYVMFDDKLVNIRGKE